MYTRDDIDISGAANAVEFVALLTQNYGTGQSEFGGLRTLGTGPQSPNPGFGTGPNLRGLGSSSTLVLVNGHRLAPSGNEDFVDVSMIPFDAIDRVEVLTDGASAIYGSDAVGGVVNFILRHDYTADESSLRVGESTHGDVHSYDASQSIGTRWKTGGAMASLQFLGHGSISNQDRDFSRRDSTDPLYGPRDLVPQMLKDAFYGSLVQSFPYGIEMSSQGFYSRRREIYQGCNAPCSDDFTGRLYDEHASNVEYEAALTLSVAINPRWKIEVMGDASQNWLNSVQTFQPTISAATVATSDLWDVAASSTGVIYEAATGDVKISLGTSHRSESFQLANSLGNFRSQSHVEAGYSELQIPLIAPDLKLSESSRLSLTLAGRYEHYSTFGSTFNPKVGIWAAVTSELSLRGAYNSAFKAPTAYQLSGSYSGRYLQPLIDASSDSGSILTLIRHGGNPDLRDQTADVWTFGLDWTSPSPGLQSTLTYFNVDYKHIIWDLSTVPSSGILSSPAYSDYVLRRDSADDPSFNNLAQSLIGDSRLVGCTPPSMGACAESVTDIGAIIDQRQANLASTQTSGIDWKAVQAFSIPAGKLSTQVETTYVIDYRQRVTPVSDAVEIANTAGNPPKVQLRAEVRWDYGDWSTRTTMNFTSGYSTRGSLDAAGNALPVSTLAAWTTFDFQLGYSPVKAGWLNGVRTWLYVTNIFDRRPPHVDDMAYGFGYDPSNANPFGRLVSVQIRKSW